MPDQNEIQEYKKKISALGLPDLKDILAHINRDKVPWKYDMVKAEIEAKETGKAAPEPVIREEPKRELKKEMPEKQAEPKQGPAPAQQPGKPAFQLRRSRLGGVEGVEQKAAAPASTPPPPQPSSPPPPPKTEEKVEPKVEKPAETKAAPEVLKAPETKPQPAPVKAVNGAAPAAVSPLDFALLGVSIVFILLAIYIVAIPFVNLPGGDAMKSLLNKIPIF